MFLKILLRVFPSQFADNEAYIACNGINIKSIKPDYILSMTYHFSMSPKKPTWTLWSETKPRSLVASGAVKNQSYQGIFLHSQPIGWFRTFSGVLWEHNPCNCLTFFNNSRSTVSPHRRYCWRATRGQEHMVAGLPDKDLPQGERRWLCPGCDPTQSPWFENDLNEL